MAAQSDKPEAAESSTALQRTETSQSRLAWLNRADRVRTRFLLFAGAAVVAVAWNPLSNWVISTWSTVIGRVPPSPSGPTGSPADMLSGLALLGPLAVILFPLGLPAAFGMQAQFCLFCDYQAPQPPLLLPLYCVASLAYFGLPIVGSFPAPRRRKLFLVVFLIFVVMLIVNVAGCHSMLTPPPA